MQHVDRSLFTSASIVKRCPFLIACVVSIALVALLCLFFEPRWETNDDIAMSMVAHGYGLASVPSPHLVFSNVIWGSLIRAIPEINGILGYTIATISVLIIAGVVVLFALLRLGTNFAVGGLILLLILVRPVLFPQFTLNAGLLSVAAITCWILYVRHQDQLILWGGCTLAFLSYLVRSHEFILVMAVALPLVPWRSLFQHRSSQLAFIVLCSAIVIAAIVDHQVYQGKQWNAFNELNPVRARITDFGADNNLKSHPEVLRRYDYSTNDIDLIRTWFFVDPGIANPVALTSMLDEIRPLPIRSDSITNGWLGIKALWSPKLSVLFLAALVLTCLQPSWRVAMSWMACVGAVFSLGLLGRPGIIRVYVPLLSLLLIAPFLAGQGAIVYKRLSMVGLMLAVLFNTSQVFSESKMLQIDSENIRKVFANFPTDPVVIWGSSFPFEALYPVITSSDARAYQLYGLGVFTLAPFSVAWAEDKKGRDLTGQLIGETGVPIIATEYSFRLLDTYCREHMHGNLQELSSVTYGEFALSRRRCITDQQQDLGRKNFL